MPLRIPDRARPTRVTIGDAFAYLVRQTIKPDSSIGRAGDVAAAVYFASARVHQRGMMTASEAMSSLPQLDFLDTDPIDIVSTIWDGIVSGSLSIEGLPDDQREKWISRPIVHDWATGLYLVNVGGQQTRTYPTLDPQEVNALFAIGLKDEEVPVTAAEAGPVALAALTAVVRGIMTSERLRVRWERGLKVRLG